MLKSDQDDRRWQWVKLPWRALAKALMRPETWRTIVRVGIWATQVAELFIRVITFMRE